MGRTSRSPAGLSRSMGAIEAMVGLPGDDRMKVVREETGGFTKAADEYERGRPGYPADAVQWVAGRAGLRPGKRVVDLAAGTGKLTRELVATGAEVVAVEPLAEMRKHLKGSLPSVPVVGGIAEATGLAADCADAVTIAQAFHWFANEATLAELARIMRRDGLLFLIWNRRELDDPLQAAISELTLPHVGATPSYGSGSWQPVMRACPSFALDEEHHSRFSQLVDRRRLVDRVASTSYIALLADEVRLPLLEQVAALIGPGQEAELPYTTDVYCYRRL